MRRVAGELGLDFPIRTTVQIRIVVRTVRGVGRPKIKAMPHLTLIMPATKTNSFAVAGVRQNWRWHPRITDVRFWGKADMARCPLFPRKQTFAIMIRMSALCQKRTSRALLGASETIVFFSSTGAAGGAEITLVSSKEALGRNYKLDPRLSASVQCLSA